MIRTYFQQQSHAWMTFDDHTVRRYILKMSGFFFCKFMMESSPYNNMNYKNKLFLCIDFMSISISIKMQKRPSLPN